MNYVNNQLNPLYSSQDIQVNISFNPTRDNEVMSAFRMIKSLVDTINWRIAYDKKVKEKREQKEKLARKRLIAKRKRIKIKQKLKKTKKE